MSTSTIDTITLYLMVGLWPALGVWELALLYWRWKKKQPPKTISMVARDFRWKFSSFVYLWCGSASHWFWTGDKPTTLPGGLLFWIIPVGLVVADIQDWKKPDFRPWYRRAELWMVLGTLSGHFMFPQTG